jgi:hypothetical protein
LSSAAPDESDVIERESNSQKTSDLDRPQGRRLERVVRRMPLAYGDLSDLRFVVWHLMRIIWPKGSLFPDRIVKGMHDITDVVHSSAKSLGGLVACAFLDELVSKLCKLEFAHTKGDKVDGRWNDAVINRRKELNKETAVGGMCFDQIEDRNHQRFYVVAVVGFPIEVIGLLAQVDKLVFNHVRHGLALSC